MFVSELFNEGDGNDALRGMGLDFGPNRQGQDQEGEVFRKAFGTKSSSEWSEGYQLGLTNFRKQSFQFNPYTKGTAEYEEFHNGFESGVQDSHQHYGESIEEDEGGFGAVILPKGVKPRKGVNESVTDDRNNQLSVGDYVWVNDWSVERSFEITEIKNDKVTLLIPKTAGKPEHVASFSGNEVRKDKDGKAAKGKATYEATSATTSTAKTYQLKKYAGAGLGMWIKDAEADGFKTKKISGDADKDNDVWNEAKRYLASKQKSPKQNGVTEGTGLSYDTLASYKKKAGAQATAADKAGDYAKGNKRFKGIVQATKKELDKDVTRTNKNVEEDVEPVDQPATMQSALKKLRHALVNPNVPPESKQRIRDYLAQHDHRDEEDSLEFSEDSGVTDPKLDRMMDYARSHYPHSKSKQEAFLKFVQRSLQHSEEDDIAQDQEIAQLDQRVSKLEQNK